MYIYTCRNYFTHSLEYAMDYSTENDDGEKTVLVCAVVFGNP